VLIWEGKQKLYYVQIYVNKFTYGVLFCYDEFLTIMNYISYILILDDIYKFMWSWLYANYFGIEWNDKIYIKKKK
jgi:hypothetical protein